MTYSQEQYDALLAVCRSYKQDVERLTEKLKQVLLAVDTVKEMNAMCDIDEQNAEIEQLKDDYAKLQELFAQYQMASEKEIKAQVKQAKIDVLNELKEKYGFYSCYLFKNDVKSLSEIIDELIKEVKK